MPGRAADQQQVGDVHAGDEEHQRDCAGEHEERTAHVLHRVVAEIRQLDLPAGAGRIDLTQPGRYLFQVCLRARQGDPRREPGDRRQEMAAVGAALSGGEGRGHPQLGLGRWKREPGRHHADDRRGLLIDANRLADDAAGAAEATLPRPVREQRDFLSAALVIGRQERAAERRSHAQDREQIRRYPIGVHALRIFTAALEVDLHALPGADAFERRRVIAPEQIVCRRDGELDRARRDLFREVHEARRLVVREWPEQHRVRHAERRRAEPDADRERQHRRDQRPGVSSQAANGLLQILQDCLHLGLLLIAGGSRTMPAPASEMPDNPAGRGSRVARAGLPFAGKRQGGVQPSGSVRRGPKSCGSTSVLWRL